MKLFPRSSLAVFIVATLAACGGNTSGSEVPNNNGITPTPASSASGGTTGTTHTPIAAHAESLNLADDQSYTSVEIAGTVPGDASSGPKRVIAALFPASGTSCNVEATPDPCPVGKFFASQSIQSLQTVSSQYMCHCQNQWHGVQSSNPVPVTVTDGHVYVMSKVVFSYDSGPVTIDVLMTADATGANWYAIDSWCDGQLDTSIAQGNGNNC